MSMENGEIPDNVEYIDEHNRERWLLKLKIARESGRVAVFSPILEQDAIIIQFPTPNRPDDAS